MQVLSKPITMPLIRETMRHLPVGEGKTFSAADLGDFSSVRSAASKLNAIDAEHRYTVTTDDNGITMTITKSAKTN